jgi:uncharacterized membrane protein
MGKFAPYVLRAYLAFRDPKFFLVVLVSYISGSLFAHVNLGYDPDFGLTNLILSIEASTASAVLMMVAERTAAMQEQMAKMQREQLATLIQMTEVTRQMLQDHVTILTEIRENDRALLEFLKVMHRGSSQH